MVVSPLTWVITFLVVIGFIVFDFISHVRKPHPPSVREATAWTLFYIALACVFGIFLWFNWGGPQGQHAHAIEFFSGYITELSLSVDNLFIFALILGSFKIPPQYQQKVLLIGIGLALVFRAIFIGIGAAAISAWSWVFYLFGIFLLYTAIKVVVDEVRDEEEKPVDDMFVVKLLRRIIPVTGEFHGQALLAKVNGKRMVTPIMLALISIGFIDLMFAFDSIPAIFGLTREPYIVFTANAFALMGLRQMYFLINGLLDRMIYLPYGLGLILAFIGGKLLLHALHENNLPFINGGESVHVPEIDTIWSLVFIVVTLVITAIASHFGAKRQREMGKLAEAISSE
ncbi:MAG: TerC family protein [Corynebacterium sp.]|nr:TerC family protein [Corynebacterium sp.]